MPDTVARAFSTLLIPQHLLKAVQKPCLGIGSIKEFFLAVYRVNYPKVFLLVFIRLAFIAYESTVVNYRHQIAFQKLLNRLNPP